MAKGYLWNGKELKTVEYDDHHDINNLLESRTFTGVTFNKKLYAFVDDEGLLIDQPIKGLWYIEGQFIQPLAGNILFTKHNSVGESIDVTEEQKEIIDNMKRVNDKLIINVNKMEDM